MKSKTIWGLITCLLLILIGGQPAVAQENGYPPPIDLYINDFAGVLNQNERDALTTLLSDLRQTSGIEMTLLTVDSYFAYNTGDTTLESFATNLFNDWGIGNAERNDGILIFLALEEREVRIELGSGYDSSMDREMEVVLSEFMLPRFREGRFGDGIYRGARAIIFEVTGEQPADVLAQLQANSSSSPASTGSSSQPAVIVPSSDPTSIDENMSPLEAIISSSICLTSLFSLLGGGWFIGRRVWGNFARNCDECGAEMTKLDEVADDAYLDEGQRREEEIGSVDYHVWACHSCGDHDIRPRRKWFSGYSRCPQCNYRTSNSSTTTVRFATYTSTGQKKITTTCRMCDHHDVSYRTIPRKTRSSSSSSSFGSSGGSSFGGGSSSGGGASGSW